MAAEEPPGVHRRTTTLTLCHFVQCFALIFLVLQCIFLPIVVDGGVTLSLLWSRHCLHHFLVRTSTRVVSLSYYAALSCLQVCVMAIKTVKAHYHAHHH
jgi:hypothetical protein